MGGLEKEGKTEERGGMLIGRRMDGEGYDA